MAACKAHKRELVRKEEISPLPEWGLFITHLILTTMRKILLIIGLVAAVICITNLIYAPVKPVKLRSGADTTNSNYEPFVPIDTGIAQNGDIVKSIRRE